MALIDFSWIERVFHWNAQHHLHATDRERGRSKAHLDIDSYNPLTAKGVRRLNILRRGPPMPLDPLDELNKLKRKRSSAGDHRLGIIHEPSPKKRRKRSHRPYMVSPADLPNPSKDGEGFNGRDGGAASKAVYAHSEKEREKALREALGPRADDWKYDKELSSKYVGVWRRGSHIMTSFRGTKIKDPNDLAADVGIIANHLEQTSRYEEARKAYKNVLEKYPDKQYEHYISGHSLGGAISKHLFFEFHDKIAHAYNYNPGESIGDVFSNVDRNAEAAGAKKMTTYTIKGDPISNLAQYDYSHRVILLSPLDENLNAHTINQFIP